MISTERLRFYRFFSGLSATQLIAVASIATQESYPAGAVLYEIGLPAEKLYFLEDGCVEQYYTADELASAAFPQGILVSEVNPGEAFSISALIEPLLHSSTAYTSKPSRIILIEARALRALFERDKPLAYLLTKHAAQAVRARLDRTRVQLAAAWA